MKVGKEDRLVVAFAVIVTVGGKKDGIGGVSV
jgi:hypothetical protein